MRILLAEDESTISRLIKQVLAAAGHDVIAVASGGEAITLLQAGRFRPGAVGPEPIRW